MKRAVLYLLPALAYAGLIFYLSSLSDLSTPGPQGSDKAAHLVEYAVLGFLAARALAAYRVGAVRAALLGALLAALYGLTDEYHQGFTPGRFQDASDAAADALGGTLGAAAWYAALGARRRRAASGPGPSGG